MGNQLLDQYSLLHFSVGSLAYFWGVDLIQLLVGHTAFELLENTETGMKFINTTLTWWPGGKTQADSITNMIGDTISVVAGWAASWKLDEIGKRRKWFTF
jgi:hypothetical protein